MEIREALGSGGGNKTMVVVTSSLKLELLQLLSIPPCPRNLKAKPLSRLKFPSSKCFQMQTHQIHIQIQNGNGKALPFCEASPSPPHPSCSVVHNDDLQALLQILPSDLHHNLLNETNRPQLLEVILDLGRFPEARYQGQDGGQYIRNTEVTVKELEYAQQAVGEFGRDNRAGIEGTLHRISAIRSRKGGIVGLTCRVGRAISGQIDMVYDLLQYGKSILFVGRPGVGKTTVMREIARVLSDEFHKRVVIVDTSNEIGGDGNIPHAAIGGARRMQVPEPSMQHRVMVEAVENHMPEVIIVDEIGTEAEAHACRSIAERGIMLIGTAHGQQLENIIKNPTLSDLIGGIETVTLGDAEARARNCQKTILERKAPPTFDFLIEMRDRHYWLTHQTDKSVDMLLRGKSPQVEVRKRDEKCKVVIEKSKAYDKCQF